MNVIIGFNSLFILNLLSTTVTMYTTVFFFITNELDINVSLKFKFCAINTSLFIPTPPLITTEPSSVDVDSVVFFTVDIEFT